MSGPRNPVGTIIHWTMMWNKPIDMWCRQIFQEDTDECEVIIADPRWPGRWEPGFVIHYNRLDEGVSLSGCGVLVVPDEDVPDFVWAEIAKRALTDG